MHLIVFSNWLVYLRLLGFTKEVLWNVAVEVVHFSIPVRANLES